MSVGPQDANAPSAAVVAWLRKEVGAWQTEGLIDPTQAQIILARYPEPDSRAGRNRTIAAFTVIGAILLALGVLLFIGANWAEMPRWLKLALLFSSTIISYLLGHWFWQVRGTYPWVGHGLVLLGTLLYGASIFLVAQIFHIRAHWPNGFLFWGLSALAIAWVVDSRPILAAGVLLLGMWNVFEIAAFGQVPWTLLPLLAVAVLPLIYRLRAPESVPLAVSTLTFWLGGALVLAASPNRMEDHFLPVAAALVLVGALSGVTSLWLPARSNTAALYSGLVLALAGIYIMTFRFDGGWPSYPFLWSAHQLWYLAGAAVVLAASFYVAWRSGVAAEGPRAIWPLALAVGVTLAGLLLPLSSALVRSVSANLVLLGMLTGAIAWGFRWRVGGAVLLGLAGFLVDIITRYFDFFWSLMDRSLFFVIGGLLLLGGGYLMERSRRRWLAVDGEGHPHA